MKKRRYHSQIDCVACERGECDGTSPEPKSSSKNLRRTLWIIALVLGSVILFRLLA